MIRHYAPLEAHESKTNLSAVVALTTFRVPNPAFDSECKKAVNDRSARERRELTWEERLEVRFSLLESIPMTLRRAPKLVVCTNPFARFPFPSNLFNGPYDERWSVPDGELKRVFAGAELAALE